MALLDALRGAPPRVDVPVPKDVQTKLARGRKEMLRDAPKRRLCIRFEKGNTYGYINGKGVLREQDTTPVMYGGSKQDHRIRNKYNMIRPLVEEKVSAATQRVPSYEVDPSTTDPEAWGAARLSEQVALYGYDQWRLRKATIKTVKNAIAAGGDGFALPYFDPDVGPYKEQEDPETGEVRMVGRGEIRVLTFNGNEVYWEPGCDFDVSPWYAIEVARPIDAIKETPGYIGGELTADANTSDIPNDRGASENMVIETQYFERPCQKYPDGRRIQIANRKQIFPEEPYPLVDADGQVLDEPILHRLSYTIDPDSDRDLGLVWQLIDAQRTVQDCLNKLLEWKNRCLNPQMIAAINSLLDRPDDTPGAVRYYRQGFDKPQWERPPDVPMALFQIYETMLGAMRFIASYQDVQVGPDVAAKAIEAGAQQSRARWESFLGDLAEWHSRVMRHCLLLVARYYTEPQLVQLRGRFGSYPVSDFQGAHLLGQVSIRVLPGSLVARTRAEVQNRLNWIAQTFPGWLTPEVALAALDGGVAEKLVESYELDVGRANRIIQKIRDGSALEMGIREDINPLTGAVTEAAAWMPTRGVDNLDVWRKVFGDWMKTEDYEALDPGLQEIAKKILGGIDVLKFEEQQAQLEQQTAMAEQRGLSNAANPQPKPMPSLPAAA